MNEQRTVHPEAPRLDAIAVGGGDEEARAHLANCAVCSAYVDALTKGADTFAQNEGLRAEAFVRAVRARERAARPRMLWTGAVASALALAAGVFFVVRAQAPPAGGGGGTGVEPSSEGPVRFKGEVQVAVIVEHAGTQSRHTDEVTLEPDDRVRLEIALDRDVRLAAGVLADDGEWAELQAPAMLGPGTHYSEQSITFEREVNEGWILVGAAEAVERGRRGRDFRGLTAIRVRAKRP